MTARTAAAAAAATVGSDAAFPPRAWESHTARFNAHLGRSGVVITIHGEIDAANAGVLAEYVERCTDYCEWLVLDLSGLDFIGTAALSALHTIKDRCAAVEANWTLVPNPVVSRVLRFCAPDRALPIDESLTDALATVQNQCNRLQLVAP
ncbi:MAG: STAS domain-containing protein [Mycobacterium sp.]